MIVYDQRVRLKETRGYEATKADVFRELCTKDINKAAASSVLNLSKVLNCDVEDLLDYFASYETEEK